jgi:bifunctional non-homologous end joining protein LigD
MALTEYARKRNFKTTREPGAVRQRGKTGHRFVVQKHAATRLHYDFRLEMDGVLKSWAVPKGIPFVKGEKHLAVEVEDHPVSYIHFEGTIPKGQYGGGTVMVWDAGTYSASGNPLEELKQGKLHFTLSGKKLQGDWYLVRLRDGKQWLLIKGGEDLKSLSQKKDDSSALSGKSMDQIAGGDRVWQSVPRRGGKKLLFKERVREKASSPKASKGLPPSVTRQSRGAFKFLEPMKARLATVPPAGDWLYEIKFDGYRALAIKNRDEVRLLSRNEKDFSKKFPEISDALAAWKTDDFIVDGEIVALDKKGVSSFQLLQAFELGEKRPPIYYYVFDLLRVGDDDYLQKSLKQRKEALAQLLKGAPEPIRFSASLAGTAKGLLKKVGKLGLEGLIGKRTDSVYEAGARSGAWIKLKLHREQELAVFPIPKAVANISARC